jgi:L-alanine-DL-glutamate epimerase-like enolase superfamily enzyme
MNASVDQITYDAVRAALSVIDLALPDAKKSGGPLGDTLAGDLHRRIEAAITEHLERRATGDT